MVDLKVLNPVADTAKAENRLAPRLSDFNGKTIGLFWNGKLSGDVINQFTAQLLANKFKDIRFKEYCATLGGQVRGATVEQLETMAGECDTVIGAVGD